MVVSYSIITFTSKASLFVSGESFPIVFSFIDMLIRIVLHFYSSIFFFNVEAHFIRHTIISGVIRLYFSENHSV